MQRKLDKTILFSKSNDNWCTTNVIAIGLNGKKLTIVIFLNNTEEMSNHPKLSIIPNYIKSALIFSQN